MEYSFSEDMKILESIIVSEENFYTNQLDSPLSLSIKLLIKKNVYMAFFMTKYGTGIGKYKYWYNEIEKKT